MTPSEPVGHILIAVDDLASQGNHKHQANMASLRSFSNLGNGKASTEMKVIMPVGPSFKERIIVSNYIRLNS